MRAVLKLVLGLVLAVTAARVVAVRRLQLGAATTASWRSVTRANANRNMR